MIAFLVAFAAQPLNTYPPFKAHKTFFAPLLKQVERREALPGCDVAFRFDVAGYVGQHAGDPREVRRLKALGLTEIQAATACFSGRKLTVTLEGSRTGLLAKLQETHIDLSGPEHYWLMGGSLDWRVLKTLDRRIEAALVAASALLDADAEPLLVDPLVGPFTAGELPGGYHFVDAEVSSSAGYTQLLTALDADAPHADFGRKKKANEWGFLASPNVFVRVDPKMLHVADNAKALDRTPSYKGRTVKAMLAGTVDVARYRKLYERVGRPDDTRNFARKYKLPVDLKAAPTPAALLTGVDRVNWAFSQQTLDASF